MDGFLVDDSVGDGVGESQHPNPPNKWPRGGGEDYYDDFYLGSCETQLKGLLAIWEVESIKGRRGVISCRSFLYGHSLES